MASPTTPSPSSTPTPTVGSSMMVISYESSNINNMNLIEDMNSIESEAHVAMVASESRRYLAHHSLHFHDDDNDESNNRSDDNSDDTNSDDINGVSLCHELGLSPEAREIVMNKMESSTSICEAHVIGLNKSTDTIITQLVLY
jgi:hypothetical protein